MSGITWFGGVRFSGAREPVGNLWTCVGREVEGRLGVVDLRPHAFRADLTRFVLEQGWGPSDSEAEPSGSVLWAIDACLAFSETTAERLLGVERPGWREVLAWVASRPPEDVREAAGDSRGGAWMLGGYRGTVEAMRWLQVLLETDGDADTLAVLPMLREQAAATTLIEVDPKATAKDLNLIGRRPLRPHAAAARVAKLEPYAVFDHPSLAAIAATLEDVWDAVLACITAFSVRDDLEQPRRLGGGAGEKGEREGWVYRHPAAVGG